MKRIAIGRIDRIDISGVAGRVACAVRAIKHIAVAAAAGEEYIRLRQCVGLQIGQIDIDPLSSLVSVDHGVDRSLNGERTLDIDRCGSGCVVSAAVYSHSCSGDHGFAVCDTGDHAVAVHRRNGGIRGGPGYAAVAGKRTYHSGKRCCLADENRLIIAVQLHAHGVIAAVLIKRDNRIHTVAKAAEVSDNVVIEIDLVQMCALAIQIGGHQQAVVLRVVHHGAILARLQAHICLLEAGICNKLRVG